MKTNPSQKPVLLITGTSKGIGRFLTEYFLNTGFFVVGCSRYETDINHESYQHFSIDIAEASAIMELFLYIRKELKRLDVLINNAAINPAIVGAALLPYETIQMAFQVNVFAPMLFCREAVKLMTRNKFGRIINMGSMATKHEVIGEALYTSTKSSLNTFSRVLAKEVNRYGITVNVVAPSAIKTELSEKIDQEALKSLLSRNAINDLGEFSDVSNIINWLIKKDSSSITGQIIYLGGA